MLNIQIAVGWLKKLEKIEKGKATLYVLTVSTLRKWRERDTGRWKREYDDIRVVAWNWNWLEDGVSEGELLQVVGRWQPFEGVGECLASEIENLSRSFREAPENTSGSGNGEDQPKRYVQPIRIRGGMGNR